MILAAIVVAVLFAILVVKFVPLKMRWLVSVLLLAASVYLGKITFDGIMEPIKFDEEKQVRYAEVIKNLKLIRDAEIKYNEAKGMYAEDKNALISFIENDSLVLTRTSNVEKEVHKGGGIMDTILVKKVDTTGYEPVIKYFTNRNYREMFKVPGTDKEFELKTGSIEKVAGLMVPVFEAKIGKEEILKDLPRHLVKQELEAVQTDQIKGAFISIGSLEKITTGGNWPPSYDKDDRKKN